MVRILIYKIISRRKNKKRNGLISKSLDFVSPLVSLFEKMGLRCILDFAVLQMIRGYQKHLSPHKGFSCAYHRLYMGGSCSEYFQTTVRIYGLKKAIPLFQRRLQECKLAHILLKSQCRCGKKHF
jgi:putative component of membrane protein insertase Oxa1/YidC/SpoIIIJ protein YidD